MSMLNLSNNSISILTYLKQELTQINDLLNEQETQLSNVFQNDEYQYLHQQLLEVRQMLNQQRNLCERMREIG